MILFIAAWHLAALLALFLAAGAFLGVGGILLAAYAALENRQGADEAKRLRRSAAARKDEGRAATANAITPDDALRFVQREEEQ